MEYIEKYIDADNLIHDLEERIYAYSKGYANGDDYRKDAIETLLKDVRNQYSLQQEQPSLPANLDKAAEKYAKPYHDKMAVVKGFKAGAEWMAGHGETFDGIVRDDGFVDFDKYGSSMMIPSNTTCLKNGDKVKIIIVKEEK